uniref:Uncharacterized protein n=1 Tax=Caenorhabditis japonica TaxID=281687 RepID=A0A8R1DQS5_CAEJA
MPCRPLNLAIVMILMGLLLVALAAPSNTHHHPAMRMKKWYTWNNDLEVTKKWYDWQNVPRALQQKRHPDIDSVIVE